ncbi:adenylate/guanylate cyclase domain-containing protein [Methylocapsa sp. D3K7]|uniref:adenylate/guanylate cyclase domain-containing protein n=1 Tax=Methylocapsa sp. D3K7 TaxID=3041435 RepID=UPI00244EC4C2|nr:adenylate/guanylate cyclase domain-containing protein [Methylocapsa sp. D3K7]WGJ13032.1 adenylate/guanylate cyclase domain-containing protein [Methylocapsa sp. D3K7]
MDKAPRGGWMRRGGVFTKFVVSFVGLVIFVLVVNGAVETWFMYRETTTALVGAQSQRAVATARRIEQTMSDIERHISWVTRASVVTIEQRQSDYAELLDQIPAIEELVQIDATGHEQLRSLRKTFTIGKGTDYSHDPRFTAALGKGVWWSPVYFHGRDPFTLIALAHLGRNAGVTVAEINLKFLSDFVSATEAGKSNTAYLVDQSGRLLADSDATQSPATDLSGLPQVAAVLNPNASPLSIGKDLSGRSVLTASAPVPQLNWFVFYEEPLSQVLAPIYAMLARVGLLMALGLMLAIGAGTLLARRMVVPIRKLQAGARELGANEFGHRIDVKTGDEVEELADHFNRMAGQLQESYSRLEQKVEERTRDLAQTVSELKVLEETGRAINSSLDLDSVLRTIVTNAVQITQADAGAIYCYDSSSGVFELAQTFGIEKSQGDAARFVRIDEDDSLISTACKKRESIFVADVLNAPGSPLKSLPLIDGISSILIVPLAGQDEVLGALVVQRKAAGALASNTVGSMQTFAHQSVLAMQNARLFHEIDQKGRELAKAHDTVQQQATKLMEQTEQLGSWNLLLEERVATQLAEIERIGRLRRFLAPQLAQVIASSDENASLLASHRREVTVVFCDLRGFTAFTESTEPEEVMKVLREYHAVLGEIIFRFEGTLDRFAGDGILILFNDPIPYPDHTQRAVRMAVEMRDSVGKLSENWRSRGHSLGFGIGIALGYATLGQVGFDRRLEYAAVGSVTNLASRLCDEAKAGQIVISQRAFGLVEQCVDAAPIGALNLKGFNRPMPAYEIRAWRDESQCQERVFVPPSAANTV